MRIPCPDCGPRDLREFRYVGDATRDFPPLDADAEVWARYVWDRDNPRGPHAEHWQHHHGCRQFLRVVRDTATHAILSAAIAGPGAPAPDADADAEGAQG